MCLVCRRAGGAVDDAGQAAAAAGLAAAQRGRLDAGGVRNSKRAAAARPRRQ